MAEKLYTNEEYFKINMADARAFMTKNRLAAYDNPGSVPPRSLDEWDQAANDHAALRRKEAGIE